MLANLRGNILSAVDVETTGTDFGYHEILQIAVVPLDHHMKPSKEHKFFYRNIAPKHPERQSVEARVKTKLDANYFARMYPSQEQVANHFEEWFISLNLPFEKKLAPLAHNWAFERGFLTQWLGIDGFDSIFHFHPRDTMLAGQLINDIYTWQGQNLPFHNISLTGMCSRFEIPLDNAHDALADCIGTAELYKSLMSCFG